MVELQIGDGTMASNQKDKKAEVIEPAAVKSDFQGLPARLSDTTVGRFFLIVSPGFEVDAVQELRSYLAGTIFAETIQKEKGGVSFEAPLGMVLAIQPKLKVVTRVLLRVAVFGAKDFPKLHKKIQALSWKTWFKPDVMIRARAASHRSRLRIKKRIEIVAEEAVAEALGISYESSEKDGLGMQSILCLLRLDDDVVTVSLDLSGELLHKRGDREDVGKAPLRESFAAAVVERSLEHLRASGLVFEWLEPMAGTGVFLHEYLRGEGLLTAPDSSSRTDAPKRTFAGNELLSIRFHTQQAAQPMAGSVDTAGTAGTAGKTAAETSTTFEPRSNLQQSRAGLFARFTLIETHAEQRRRASELAPAGVPPAGIPIQVLASAEAWQVNSEPRFVVVNPPWGKRLKTAATDTVLRQEEFLARLEAQFLPAFVACVMPALGRRPRLPKGWEQAASVRFRAGGILVAASFFRVRSRLGDCKPLALPSVDNKG